MGSDLVIYLEDDVPAFDMRKAVIDFESGFALDVPLGIQAPRQFWIDNVPTRERIERLREERNITVADDMLTAPVDVTVEDGKTKKPSRRKQKVRPRSKPSKLAKSNRMRRESKSDAILTTRERAAYMEWKDWEGKGTPGVFPNQLRRYWLGEGLARWATTPTPYRSLVAALRKEGVPGHMIHGLAARLYHWHFGTWPGKHNGKKAWEDLRNMQLKFSLYEMETK